METKALSCGVLVLDRNQRLLLIHTTGQSFWDIPKGTQHPGESPIETAIRELEEETGLRASPEQLTELGWYHYNRHKDLYLFMMIADEVDVSSMSCSGTFFNENGSEVPEADDFRMFSLEESERLFCGSMSRLYDSSLGSDIRIIMNRLF